MLPAAAPRVDLTTSQYTYIHSHDANFGQLQTQPIFVSFLIPSYLVPCDSLGDVCCFNEARMLRLAIPTSTSRLPDHD